VQWHLGRQEMNMIDQISAGGTPGGLGTPKLQPDLTKAQAIRTEKEPIRSEKAPEKPATPREDSVQLSPSAQARILRREGKSIPQIAIQLGLSIPTVDAFFKE
jgi:DNA-binding NarL/FixJ family response regulator